MKRIFRICSGLSLYLFIAISPSCGQSAKSGKNNAADAEPNEDNEEIEDELEDISGEDSDNSGKKAQSSPKAPKQPTMPPDICPPIQTVGGGITIPATATATVTATSTNSTIAVAPSTVASNVASVRGISANHKSLNVEDAVSVRIQSGSTNAGFNSDTTSLTQNDQTSPTNIDSTANSNIQNLQSSTQSSQVQTCVPTTNQGIPSVSTNTATATAPFNAFEELFGESESKACNARGLFFDRNAKTCLTDVILAKSFECSKSGVSAKFETVKVLGVDKIFDKNLSEGFVIDQCGERGPNPIVSFYNKSSFRVRLICAQGDPLCAK